VAEFETDAAALWCRTAVDGRIDRVAMVDGSTFRATGRRSFDLALPRRASDYYFDSRIEEQSPCAGSPVS